MSRHILSGRIGGISRKFTSHHSLRKRSRMIILQWYQHFPGEVSWVTYRVDISIPGVDSICHREQRHAKNTRTWKEFYENSIRFSKVNLWENQRQPSTISCENKQNLSLWLIECRIRIRMHLLWVLFRSPEQRITVLLGSDDAHLPVFVFVSGVEEWVRVSSVFSGQQNLVRRSDSEG